MRKNLPKNLNGRTALDKEEINRELRELKRNVKNKKKRKQKPCSHSLIMHKRKDTKKWKGRKLKISKQHLKVSVVFCF